MFNWLSLLNAVPFIVAGTQQLLAGQPGTTKKQTVLNVIGLGEGAAAAVDPALAPVFEFANTQIDSWVAFFHKSNAPGFGTNSAAAAPAAK